MSKDNVNDEVLRRLNVVEEKLAGALIESVERMRSNPIVQSISFRILNFHQSLIGFRDIVGELLKSISAYDKAEPHIKEIANYQIITYNSIIEDLQTNFKKKDSYIKSFSKIDLFDEPTIADLGVMIHKISNNNLQILTYLIRWSSA